MTMQKMPVLLHPLNEHRTTNNAKIPFFFTTVIYIVVDWISDDASVPVVLYS